VLKVQDLVVHYGKIEALHGISLTVETGQIVTLIGANGAGKSTTLRTISGLIKPTGGYIEFDGQDITDWDASQIVRSGISHCPEGRQVFPEMTVLENLELGAYSRQDKSSLAAEYELVYNFFPILYERRRQLAGTLSGGEQQMLAIGRALMAKPRLLLLDEPSLGLAPLLVETIFKIIQAINQQGVTILLIEQNAYQALTIAHYGYVLDTGRVVVAGPASELINNEQIKKAYLGE